MIVGTASSRVALWRPLLRPVGLMLTWDVLVTLAFQLGVLGSEGVTIQYTLYGTAVALFLGFMVNAAYARWWEARSLWGTVTNYSRNLAREAVTLIDGDAPDGRRELPAEAVRAVAAYAHVLRTSLRGQDAPPELTRLCAPPLADRVTQATNRPNALLSEIGKLVAEARARDMIEPLARVQMEATLSTLADAQGGLERIKNTPLPVQYRALPSFFARMFCVILPFGLVDDLGWLTPVGSALVGIMFLLAVQVGRELADPFLDGVHDVPMTAISRTIEIDVLETIGHRAPDRVAPADEVLW